MLLDIAGKGGTIVLSAVVTGVIGVLLYFVIRPLLNYYLDKQGLRKYPGLNWACGITNLGFVWEAFRGHRTLRLHRMHKKHSVIRLGPNSLCFSDARAVKDIYGHSTACRKDDVYRVIQGVAPHVLDVVEKDDHSRKRRLVANAYSSRNVETWEYKVADKVERLIARFDEYCERDEVLDFRKWTNLFTVEAIADIGLSHRMNFLENGNDLVPVQQPDGSIHEKSFIRSLHGGNAAGSRIAWETVWFSSLVRLCKFFSASFRTHLRGGDDFGQIIKSLLRQRLVRAADNEKLDDFFQSLVTDRAGSVRDLEVSELEAETTLMMNAGSDTTAIQLTNVMYQLLKNPSKLSELRKELDSALGWEGDVVAYKHAKPLRYLRSCLDEALRITPPVSFGLPRRTPPEGATIGGTWIPGDITVCIPAYIAHRDESWFPDPESYQPERWLNEDAAKLQSQFIAFSAGARGCLGRNISYLEQYVLIASLLKRYDFALLYEDWEIERREDFNLLPGSLPVKIRRRTLKMLAGDEAGFTE